MRSSAVARPGLPRGDEAKRGGGPDRRDLRRIGKPRDMLEPNPHIDTLKLRARNFRD
jgi:error-prone DNA polymerase